MLSVIGIFIALQVHLPPGDQSHQASDQTWLLQLMTIISTPVFVGVVLFIVYSAFAFRQKRGALEDGPPSRGNFRVQVAWVAITAVIVLILAGLGINELGSQAAGQDFSASSQSLGSAGTVGTTASRSLQVQVIAQQWYFTYRYADYGGVESLHLVLPVDANVELHITSTDVLHSFWAYQLGVKADANPGVDNITYLTTERTGTFTVRCAELCGIWHGNMSDESGQVISQAEFATWIVEPAEVGSGPEAPAIRALLLPAPAGEG